ncbi:MAG: Lrp/AsnC family transcriptional regulator [Methylococcaceae bacterium]
MDALDLELMRLTQAGLPLVAQPYQLLAEQLDITAQEVMSRLQAMQDNGVIRRIGAVPNHYKLGYRFNGMSVWNIADEAIDECGKKVGQLSFVSHCYHRPRQPPDWHYNLFAMLHAKSQAEINQQIQHIVQLLGEFNRGYEVLYSTQILKKTGFRSG